MPVYPKSSVESFPARQTPHCPRLPARSSPRIIFHHFDSRQRASAFNQPLSFDTSSVTNMNYMFYVRSSSCPAPHLQ